LPHLGFFALALMTKETALALPVLWGVQLAWGHGRRDTRRWLVAGAWLTMVVARFVVHPGAPHATAEEVLANVPLLAIALGQLAVPVRPTVLAIAGDLSLWPGIAIAIAIGFAAWRLPRARRPVIAFGAFAFLLFLAPVLTVPGTLVLDHRLVLPAVGVLLILGEIARALRPERRMLVAFSGVGVAALALITVGFEGAFRDPGAFAREAVAFSPRSPMAHFCLGQVEQRAGHDDRALAEYRTALALGPAEVVHNDIAVLAMKDGHWPEAEAELRAELALNPGYGTAEYNLAIVLRREGRMPEACDAVKSALEGSLDSDESVKQERDRDCAP
jgi:tetratricopeptide (TPR) repeat protein